MNIVIDISRIVEFFALPADQILLHFLLYFGWLPILITLLWGIAQLWLYYIQLKWAMTNKFVLLAIDVPRGNAQSPKAVENLFTYLAGAHGSQNYLEKWWLGEFQLSFSFEIISIEGYIQYLIHTPVQYRNLVEAAVYSQYPDAEITEINDYTEGAPNSFPDEEYDIYGGEFVQVMHWAFPIKTYKDFEHQFGAPEVQYKDTNAALMDMMSSLSKGEQFWYQIIVVPIGAEWEAEAETQTKLIIGEKEVPKKNAADVITDTLIKWIGDFSEMVFSLWGDIKDVKKEEKDEPFKMMNLKPKQKAQIEAIHEKTRKLGFATKIRVIYLAKKEAMNKPKVINGFSGYIKQFNTNDLNCIKPDLGATGTITKANYLFKDSRLRRRKNLLMKYYKQRESYAGHNRGLLNIEELATIWHFPIETVVKAPLMQRTVVKHVEPPMNLPFSQEMTGLEIFENDLTGEGDEDIFSQEPTGKPADSLKGVGIFYDHAKQQPAGSSGPPENLPFV